MLCDLPQTGLVIPCYNEARRLPVEAIAAAATRWPWLHFCLVNDGSLDATAVVLETLASRLGPQGKVLTLDQNQGKAEAVRSGILQLAARLDLEYLGYWDADLATPLEMVPEFLTLFQTRPELKAVSGCRLRRLGARIERRFVRHILGRGFATLVSLWLQLPVYDTQCGAKLFALPLARQLFAEPFVSRWLFDVELFHRITTAYGQAETCRMVLEHPLEQWQDMKGSKIHAGTYVATLAELVRIMWVYRSRK